jgi:hypothetical protein
MDCKWGMRKESSQGGLGFYIYSLDNELSLVQTCAKQWKDTTEPGIISVVSELSALFQISRLLEARQ